MLLLTSSSRWYHKINTKSYSSISHTEYFHLTLHTCFGSVFLQNKQSVEIEDFNLKVKALCERKRGAATEMQGKTEIREFSFKSLLCERSFRQPELLRFSVPQYFIPLSSCRFMTNIQNCGTLTLSHVRIPTRRNKFLNNKQLKKKKSKKSLTANNDGRNQ